MELVRLNKYLKDMDICSRRKADEFIEKGFVKVNGIIVQEMGYKIDPAKDKVELLPALQQEKEQFKEAIKGIYMTEKGKVKMNKPKKYQNERNTRND